MAVDGTVARTGNVADFDDLNAEIAAKAAQADLEALETRVAANESAASGNGRARDPVAAWAGSNITLSGSQTVDGVTLSNGDRVGVGAQSDASENGVYTYSDSGAWTRATDMDASGEISLSTVFVSGGTTYGGHSYRFSVADPDTFVLDTDDITATQVGDTGALQSQIDAKADAADAALTGAPTAPTASPGTDTTQLASTAFVQQELAPVLSDREDAGLTAQLANAPILPIAWDTDGNIALGLDTGTGQLTGAGMDALDALCQQTGALKYPPRFALYSHVCYYGQSLSAGVGSGTPITTSQPYSHVTFDGGVRDFSSLSSFIPLVEATVETGVAACCNYAASLAAQDGVDPSDFILLGSSAGQGSQTISELSKEDADDWYRTQLYEQIEAAVAINPDYSLVAVPWFQGESDVLEPPTSEAAYKAALEQLVADINFDANFINPGNGPVHLLTYQTLVRSRITPGISRAQWQAAKSHALIHLVTPIYHIEHATDDTHLTAGGYRHLAAYFGRAVDYLRQGLEPPSLRPISATRRGAEIRVRMDVPTLPLVLDTTDLPSTTDYGFAVEDTTGVLTIDSVTVDGSEVVITTTTTPSGATEVRYARDYISGSVPADFPSSAATGNLRDSTPGTIDVSGSDKSLWYPAIHFDLTVTELSE
ncbi:MULTISPECIES: sialate O-acetylesterase [unclassified Mameliella]|uniref:sialate O-acetylesterase n=1 Tax=unclassified Mameliella TaxID=2630630 RepID=UPI0027400D13|nr:MULTISPECIES: sialate O-acetylesterase [unclassified Mameliella]